MAVIAPLGLEGLKAKVAELYKFRDHFFEKNNLSEARGKAGQVAERKSALLEVFRVEESKVAAEERATFLYLKGRVQNISGEYSPDAEATLSKAVKLNPDLVDAWNELGECYMMKQDWETAKTCFEGALQHRKVVLPSYALASLLPCKTCTEEINFFRISIVPLRYYISVLTWNSSRLPCTWSISWWPRWSRMVDRKETQDQHLLRSFHRSARCQV